MATLSIVVFTLYLASLFALGLWTTSRSQSETDYWIAGGKLGWLLGGATLAATHASAGTFIGTIGVIYGVGWSFAWLLLSIPLAYWFLAAVLAPRFTRVRQFTLPSFLESRYRSLAVRQVAAVIILVATVVYIQAQIVAGGLIANVVLGISPTTGMVGFTAVLILYTMLGGMVAVVYTDLLQLVVMLSGALLAVPLALRRMGGLGELLTQVQVAKPDVFSWGTLPPMLLLSMGVAFTLGSVSTPEKLIRLYAMKDMRTIRRGVLLAIVTTTIMNLGVFVLALTSIVLFPDLETGDLAMPMVAREVLPPILGALLLAAITAAMMSTVDSLLLVASSALLYDLVGSWRKVRGAAPLSASTTAWLNRIGVTIVGVVPLVLILSGVGKGELVQFIVLLFSALMAASFFAPVVLGVYWQRANAPGALAAMVVGCTVTFAWKAFGSANIDPVLPGFAASVVAFVVVSLATAPIPSEETEIYFSKG